MRLRILTLTVCAVLLGQGLPARAQSNVWDATISNTNWYVPVPHLLAYAAPRISFANPVPIGDQTLWTLGVATNGAFTGTSTAQLNMGLPVPIVSNSTIQGFVTTDGRITMVFTPTGGGVTTVGLGQMRNIGGVTAMEMQMITGDALLVTHWASMLPYDPLTFTPPPPAILLTNASPQWAWTAGTPWRIVSPSLFGTSAPGRFVITNYQNGYLWGRGIGPSGSSTGMFTLLGSITPDGKVLLSTVSRGNLTSLYGDVAGGPLAAQMQLSEYNSLGMTTGGFAFISLIRPYSEILAEMNNRSALGAARALFRIAVNPTDFSGAMLPVLDALDSLSGRSLSSAISQTVPVLAGAASQATYNTQRGLQQVVSGRLDVIRGVVPNDNLAAERNIWLRPLGGVLTQDGIDGVPGYRASGGGLAAGADRTIDARLALGGVLAYSRHSIKSSDDTAPSTLDVSSYRAGAYGAYALGRSTDLDFQVDGALNRNNESRPIWFMNRSASARYDSYTMHAGVGVKTTIPMDSGFALVPSLRADFGQVRADAYRESGAGVLSLNVDSQTYRELMVSAGVKGIYRIAEHLHMTANAGVGYNTLDDQVQVTASYAGGGDSFVTQGLDASPWLYSAGVGLVGAKSGRLSLSVRYDVFGSPTGLLNQVGSIAIKTRM